MTWADILAFVVVAALLVMSPGPSGVLVAKTVPTSGRPAGFANIAGFVTALYLHGALSILGISIVLVQSAEAFLGVKLLGAAYLCWLGAKALIDAVRGTAAPMPVAPARRKRRLTAAYVEGFLTNALNPKVSMFYLAAFPQFMTVGEGAVGSAFLLVCLHAMLNAVWFAAMVLLFARLARAAGSPRVQRWLRGITGVVFLGFGARLAAYKPGF